jgi:DNA-binding response OmpR family regulator
MSSKGRILIVEDDKAMISMLEYLLRGEEYEFQTGTGEKALRLAEEYQPDLILLDIMMHPMDGQEWSLRARANEKINKIPIIVMSAASPEVIYYEYKDLQASSFLTKPFDLDRLLNLIYAYTNNQGPRDFYKFDL